MVRDGAGRGERYRGIKRERDSELKNNKDRQGEKEIERNGTDGQGGTPIERRKTDRQGRRA